MLFFDCLILSQKFWDQMGQFEIPHYRLDFIQISHVVLKGEVSCCSAKGQPAASHRASCLGCSTRAVSLSPASFLSSSGSQVPKEPPLGYLKTLS